VTVHLGILALMLVITAGATVRLRRRREAADLVLLLLAVSVASLEGAIAYREARFDRAWNDISGQELVGRTRNIVDFLREKGSGALGQLREIGEDPDTRSLLESDATLARTARRPVFLDLYERFPPDGTRGVTVYDARGVPRAWSGWSPTATTSLNREPRRDVESVAIREGNIYTLLEVVHPIRDETGRSLGFVAYQEPLRVQFPLENRILQVEDVLERLEGGGGVRADVALELRIGTSDALRGIHPGPLKRHVGEDEASASASILTASGEACGRVSLSGLSRRATFLERIAFPYRVRSFLLLALFVVLAARGWVLSGGAPGPMVPVLRLSLLAAVRWVLILAVPRPDLDPLRIFDPSWFASIHFGGLLRSPGDFLLTAAVVLLAMRELRRAALAASDGIESFARRHPVLAAFPALVVALLIGSLTGLHWTRVTDVARNANVPLYSGLDPFTSAPVAALELGLLFLGMGFLLAGDTLGTLALRFLSRWKRVLAIGLTLALALVASAAKMGVPDQPALTDLLRPIPALLALVAFHLASRRWGRPGGAAIVFTALLAAATNVGPLFEGVEGRRRELVELFALEHTESPSNSRHFLMESMIEYFATSEELLQVLEDGPSPENANLSFILWARSPLASQLAGSRLVLHGAEGRIFSSFSLSFPAELRPRSSAPADIPADAEVVYERREVGSARIDLYNGAIPLKRGGRTLGFLELAMVYRDDLGLPGADEAGMGGVFSNLTASDEFLRFKREVPDRIDRYRGDALVASTDPEGGLGKRVPAVIVETLAGPGTEGRWVERRIGGRLWDLYCIRERDGDTTVGYLTFGIERSGIWDVAGLVARSVLVTLVLVSGLLLVLTLAGWAVPREASPTRVAVPRIGFRERVIGGFLVVSLLPTVLLGLAGRSLFVQEKRQEFEQSLQDDLRVSRELLGRRLSDAAHNAAGSDEVLSLLNDPTGYRTLSTPASVDGIVVISPAGQLLGASRDADLDMTLLPSAIAALDRPIEFFRRRGTALSACALVPVRAADGEGFSGAVLAFRDIDAVLAAELERRLGSAISFFAGGRLTATSKPELYQSEILSDLVEPVAYRKIELEGARQSLLEHRVGQTSFLSAFAPLLDTRGEPAGIVATLSPYRGAGLDPDASQVLSRIYFLCLLVLTLAIVAAFVLAGRLTRPISELTRGAERIGAGRLGERILTRATGEIGRLIESFNRMSTQLAESEARDRERREYIEAIIRHVGSGVVSFDAAGRIATVNEAASGILGAAPASLVGRPVAEVRRDDHLGDAAQAVLAAVEPMLEGRQEEIVREFDVEGEKDDDLRSFRLVATPLVDSEGRAQGAVAVFEDLTDLIKSKKITAWAEMARQVAHEIKNPLTPMKLSAQHLQQAWRDKHPKFDRILEESTETIVDRCEALRRIAIEFSDYARMPGRRIRREDLGRLLNEARRLYGETEERRVDFTLAAPESELFTRIDRDEVMRLFINLIENSIQAMPDGGDLDVCARRENGAALVTIRDTGVGIPSENLKRIFEPSFSTKTGGAGLGLPICRAIMEDYGGSIRIDSRTGQGTTVTLAFPVDEARPEGAEE
jgi:PAS domain S-box-containing protein